MAFDEVRLPEDVEQGAVGGPRFNTTIVSSMSGHEWRNRNWSQARGEWDIGYGISSLEDLQAVVDFFYARHGRHRGFRFKDWGDFTATNQPFQLTDDPVVFQLIKRYGAGQPEPYDRIITKPVSGTLVVIKNASPLTLTTDYTVDLNTGLVTLAEALEEGDALSWDGEFDVPVRFDADKLDVSVQTFQAGAIPSIPVMELKL